MDTNIHQPSRRSALLFSMSTKSVSVHAGSFKLLYLKAQSAIKFDAQETNARTPGNRPRLTLMP